MIYVVEIYKDKTHVDYLHSTSNAIFLYTKISNNFKTILCDSSFAHT